MRYITWIFPSESQGKEDPTEFQWCWRRKRHPLQREKTCWSQDDGRSWFKVLHLTLCMASSPFVSLIITLPMHVRRMYNAHDPGRQITALYVFFFSWRSARVHKYCTARDLIKPPRSVVVLNRFEYQVNWLIPTFQHFRFHAHSSPHLIMCTECVHLYCIPVSGWNSVLPMPSIRRASLEWRLIITAVCKSVLLRAPSCLMHHSSQSDHELSPRWKQTLIRWLCGAVRSNNVRVCVCLWCRVALPAYYPCLSTTLCPVCVSATLDFQDLGYCM